MPLRRSKRLALKAANTADHQPSDPSSPASRQNASIPEWFLEHRVKTAEELQKATIRLIVAESDSSPDLDGSSAPRGTMKNYELSPMMYKSIRNIVTSSVEDTHGWLESAGNTRLRFANDFVRLSFPDTCAKGSHDFFQAVVEYFARDIGADLLTLSPDDLADLVLQHSDSWHRRVGQEQALSQFFSDSQAPATRENYLLHIFSSPRLKATSELPVNHSETSAAAASSSAFEPRPMIIHVTDVLRYSASPLGQNISRAIQKAIKNLKRSEGRILVIGSDNRLLCGCEDCGSSDLSRRNPLPTCPSISLKKDPPPEGAMNLFRSDWQSHFGANPRPRALLIAPNHSESQCELLEADRCSHTKYKNLTYLREFLRLQQSSDTRSRLLVPYAGAEWQFESSRLEELLQEKLIDVETFRMAHSVMTGAVDVLEIERALLETEKWPQILEGWKPGADRSEKEWDGFTDNVKKVFQEIKKYADKDGDPTGYKGLVPPKYAYENRLLDSIIKPSAAKQTWDDIELDEETKETVMDLINLDLQGSGSTYGLLEDNRINGLLLYGPPGTGKSHLASIIAREAKATMIHVSAADLVLTWVGETEKMIKALFSLGRMLFPSIIFVDEADSLFRARAEGDRSWERNQVTQLLRETEGLEKHKTQPFLMLATNHPEHLDHAVIRRVPSRIYMGFPGLQARHRILAMFLRKEQLDQEVELESLAARTRRYTGSDLRYLCVRAARLSEAELRASGQSGIKRVLKTAHFDKALNAIPPTVSEEALGPLKRFAKEFNPAAVPSIRLEPLVGVAGQPLLRGIEPASSSGDRELRVRAIEAPPTSDPVAGKRPLGFLEDANAAMLETPVMKKQKTGPSAVALQIGEQLMKELPYQSIYSV